MEALSTQPILPIVLALAVIVVTFLLWSWWTSEDEAQKKRAAKKSEKAGSILEGLTERERQRRRKLEDEVEQIRQIKLKKQQEIEQLAQVTAQEQVKVREQQEVDQKIADQKKEEAEEQKRAEKDAIATAHKQGVLCSFKEARLDNDEVDRPDVQLRIKLMDSVGFPTRIHHVKGRLKSDYPGQPPEHRQRILHRGQVVGDHTKLLDLFTAHDPKTSPLPFFVVVGNENEGSVDTAKPREEAKPEPKPERKKKEVAPTDPIRVTIKPAMTAEDPTTLELHLGSSIAEVKAAHESASGGAQRVARLVFGGKVLQDDETLMMLVASCLDKRSITLHAAAAS